MLVVPIHYFAIHAGALLLRMTPNSLPVVSTMVEKEDTCSTMRHPSPKLRTHDIEDKEFWSQSRYLAQKASKPSVTAGHLARIGNIQREPSMFLNHLMYRR